MSGIEIVTDLAGRAETVRLLRALELRTGNLTPAMDEIGSMLVASVGQRFATETGPDGTPWVRSHRAEEDSGQTLSDSGRLRQSITHAAGPASVEIGTNLVYAAIHQAGGQAGRGLAVTLPARPYLGLTVEDEAEIDAILRDYLRALP